MAGKTLDTKVPTSIDALKERVNARYVASLWEHPNGYGDLELAMLKSGERERIIMQSRWGTPEFNASLWNRLSLAYGLVAPSLADDKDPHARAQKVAALLEDYPDDFIIPAANQVWELTNELADKDRKAADGPGNFPKTSSAPTGSPPPSASPSAASTS